MNSDFLPPRGQNQNHTPNRPFQPRHGDSLRPAAYRPTFRTPEEVAAEDDQKTTHAVLGHTATSGDLPPKKANIFHRFKAWFTALSKKKKIIFITVAVIVLAAVGFAVYYFIIKSDPKPAPKPVAKQAAPAPKPQPLVSTLTGLPITDASVNQRPVTAVMIENSPDARPQSGINQAGVVFEAIAEGGITRFLTLFQDTEPDYIGPVRSVRPYYIQWLAGFDAAVAHVGGSGDALSMLKQGQAKDLDQFYNTGPYHRINTRYAPHNMYSNVVALRELQTQKGFTSSYNGFPRKAEAKSATPNATSIDFNISGAIYNPHYDWDTGTNSYKRSEGGKPHIDEKSGQQLSPKVVIALTMQQGANGIYTTYNAIGSGEATVFQDGIVTKGSWEKADLKSQIIFKDASGNPLKLDPGQTWISAVGDSSRITYK
jgi:hypothetical protein